MKNIVVKMLDVVMLVIRSIIGFFMCRNVVIKRMFLIKVIVSVSVLIVVFNLLILIGLMG